MTTGISPIIAVDLGGTKILSAIIDKQGNILARDYRPTDASRGVTIVIDNVVASVEQVIAKSSLTGKLPAIAMSAAGISNQETGIVYRSPNLPGWKNVPLKEIVENRTGKQTFLINDANAAALGELHYGAAIGAKNCIYVTISTGIGGGIIIDGKLYAGSTGMAGEIGHMVVEPDGLPCNCGSKGCWEQYASGSAIARRARKEIQNGKRTDLVKMAEGNLNSIDAPLIKQASQQGDVLAQALIAESARYLAIGLGNLINIFNPELIVVGGGYAKIGTILLRPAFKQAADRSYKDIYKATRFRMAKLGDNSGVLGAAAYARLEMEKA